MANHKLVAIIITFVFVCNCVFVSNAASESSFPIRTFYVSSDGTGDGSAINAPSNIYNISVIIQPGDTVKLLGGIYNEPAAVILTTSGTKEYPITWENYDEQPVIFDGIKRDVNLSDPYSEKCVIQLENCDWQILRGFTVRNAPGHGIGDFGTSSNHNVFENIIAEDNYGNGIIVRGDYNTLIDCVSRYNYDYAGDASTGSIPGDNGDGISPDGKHTKLIRCISHHNSDDGFDCWFGEHGMFVNCAAFSNGTNEGCRNRDHGQWEADQGFGGNGNGFKLGKGGDGATCYQAFNTAIRCIAYNNLSGGFDTNQGGGNVCINCTAYNNNTSDGGIKDFNASYSDSNTGTRTNIFINNLALNTYTKPIKMSGPVITRNNSWNLWNQDTYELDKLLKDITPAEYTSVAFPNENSSWSDIKASDFLKLKADSKCIDKGVSPKEALETIVYTDKSIAAYNPDTDLGLDLDEIFEELDASSGFSGEGWDLGAFETITPPATPITPPVSTTPDPAPVQEPVSGGAVGGDSGSGSGAVGGGTGAVGGGTGAVGGGAIASGDGSTPVGNSSSGPFTNSIVGAGTGPVSDGGVAVAPSPIISGDLPSDIKGHWAEKDIAKLFSMKVINGFPDHSIKPDLPVTRAESAVLIAKSLGLQPSARGTQRFKDTIPGWAQDYLSALVDKSIFTGYGDNTFKPSNTLTRKEAVVILIRAYEFGVSDQELSFDDKADIPVWAKGSVAKAMELGIINGYEDNTFKPDKNITRAELSCMISRCLELTNQ